ncbi:hypothetical protein OfM2_20390 [Lactovum odontotermitis]
MSPMYANTSDIPVSEVFFSLLSVAGQLYLELSSVFVVEPITKDSNKNTSQDWYSKLFEYITHVNTPFLGKEGPIKIISDC